MTDQAQEFKLGMEIRYRVIFDFTSPDQVETFLEKVAANLDSGTLKITGPWSWGAEYVRGYEPQEDNDE